MLRCRPSVRLEHYGLSSEYASSLNTEAGDHRQGRLRRWWRRWCALSLGGRARSVAKGALAALVGYTAATAVASLALAGAAAREYRAVGWRDHTLEEWASVEPTLRAGDVLLLRGEGPLSWAITAMQMLFTGWHPQSLKSSHVAIVVAAKGEDITPLMSEAGLARHRQQQQQEREKEKERGGDTPPKGAAERLRWEEQRAAAAAEAKRRERGVVILEAMDNKDYHVPDINGEVRYDSVQLVLATDRLTSRTAAGRPAYRYFSVRRLRRDAGDPAVQKDRETLRLARKWRRLREGDAATVSVTDTSPLYADLRPAEDPAQTFAADRARSPLYDYPFFLRDLRAAGAAEAAGATEEPAPLPPAAGDAGVAAAYEDSQRARLVKYCRDNVGRKMSADFLFPAAFVSTSAYVRIARDRFRTREVSCGELVVELLQAMGVAQRRWHWVPLAGDSTSTDAVPMTEVERLEEWESANLTAAEAGERVAARLSLRRALRVRETAYGSMEAMHAWPPSQRPLPVAQPEELPPLPWEARAEARLTEAQRLAAEAQRQPVVSGTVVEDPQVPGRRWQLQYDYQHDALCTGPCQLADGLTQRILKFTKGYYFEKEIKMPIPSVDEPDSNLVTDYY